MQAISSKSERWHFSAAALLTVVFTLIIATVALVGYTFWSTARIDERALERQRTMFAEVLQNTRLHAQRDIENVAIFDDAVINTKTNFNINWINATFGHWLHDVAGQSSAALLDAANRPIYAMRDGEAVSPSSMAETSADLAPNIAAARSLNAGRTGNTDGPRPQAISDYIIVDGVPSIASVMPIVSSSGKIAQPPTSEYVLIATIALDDALASRLSESFLFENARFTLTPTTDADRATYPVLSNSGRFIAFFEWERDRPGRLMLQQTAPVLTAAFVIVAAIVVLLLTLLRSSAQAIEAGRRNAEYQAAHDRLTGLPNRASFDSGLTKALNMRQPDGAQITLMMLDLDRFKQVNDTLGHQAGDMLIAAVGERIRSIVGPNRMIARLGGDEFGILITGSDSHTDIQALSAEIIEAISRPFEINNFRAHVGASIGIATSRNDGTAGREMVRMADIALYEAKAAGRNRAVEFEEHMNELLQLQHTIEGELREALRGNEQLSVAFQPLIDQKTRRVVGAEALARWNHPKFGQISPARFIPVAENTGLIEALGTFVLSRACELGSTVPGRTIAVNISPTQLRNPEFSSTVFDILYRTGMRPTDLELEITESILLDDEHVSSLNLRTFRDAGIHIALDDFGTGYSSLSYLKRYPVDRIKIDRSFVSQLADGHVSVAITQAIVTLAHAMDLQVTAEGVETEKQAEILGALGCNTLQGFLFSSGTSPEQITEIFANAANKPLRGRRTSIA